MFHNSKATSVSVLALTTITGLSVLTTALPLSTLQAVAQSTTTALNPAKHVKVFLPRNPGQQHNLGYVEPVWRQTANPAIAQFAIGQVIAGPTPQERRAGFMAPIRLSGSSNCGRDFTLSITSGNARLKFCRQVVSAGVGDDARAISSLNATLKQFPTIRSVAILDRNGNCLGDMSGQNLCLRR